MLQLPTTIDQKSVRAYRLSRTRALLAEFGMDAAVLYSPLSLREFRGDNNPDTGGTWW